jgi:hypothetical protein
VTSTGVFKKSPRPDHLGFGVLQVGSTTIGLDDFYGDGDQDVEQLRSDSEQPDRLEVYEDDDDGSELGSFNV